MSNRAVSAYLLREMFEEQFALLTLDWYRSACADAIQREVLQIARPKGDKWRTWDNRIREYEYKEEIEKTTLMLWQIHRDAFQQRWHTIIERHIAETGDYWLMSGGGSTHDMILWVLKETGEARDGEVARYVPGRGTCTCERQRKLKERTTRREAAEAQGAAPYGFVEAIVLEEEVA